MYFDIKVAVLILNWNGIDFTVPCINSLFAGSIQPSKIFVVDNASIDNSVNILKTSFETIELIENQCNLGFAGGNNVGFLKIMSENYDYIWVLNNDTVVDTNCLCNLLEVMENDKGIAAATGKILYEGTADLIWYAGSKINYRRLKSWHIGALQRDKGQFDVPRDVPFISGCSMFLRKSTLEKTGFFDNNFFAYSEDFDWCLRAGDLGLRLRYIPKAKLYHKVSATFNKIAFYKDGGTSSPLAIYLTTRNRMYIIRKHAKGAFHFFSATIDYMVWNIYYGTGLIILFRMQKFKYLIKGIADGCLNNLTNS